MFSTGRFSQAALRFARRALAARRGGVALMFAVLAPLLIVASVGAMNISEELTARSHLLDATDAAALAVAAADAENPSTPEATLKQTAGSMLSANFIPYSGSGGTPVITQFVLCTTYQQTDCNGGPVTNTVKITTQVRAPCWLTLMMPGICTGDGQSQLLTAANTTNVGLPQSIQWNFILDTSGSMIVGSTPNDVQNIENWNNVAANWAAVNDTCCGSTPCAFACHYESNPANVTSGASGSDMDQGITNAHAANATTRYDVTLSATSEAISYIQQLVTSNSQLAKNSYYFNLYWMANNLNSAWSATAKQANDWSDAEAAVTRQNLPVGLSTHISTALQPLTTSTWAGGTGASYSSPKKVVFLITDGLQSDFSSDFPITGNNCGTGPTINTAWSSLASGKSWTCYGPSTQGWTGHYYSNTYASPISTSLCNSIKANNVTLAVLETPYVPLTGQSPGFPLGNGTYGEFFMYEQFIRPVIYPNGPNTSSAVSTALQNCASSPQLYSQASSTDPTSILAGLQTLVKAYLASNAFLKQ